MEETKLQIEMMDEVVGLEPVQAESVDNNDQEADELVQAKSVDNDIPEAGKELVQPKSVDNNDQEAEAVSDEERELERSPGNEPGVGMVCGNVSVRYPTKGNILRPPPQT